MVRFMSFFRFIGVCWRVNKLPVVIYISNYRPVAALSLEVIGLRIRRLGSESKIIYCRNKVRYFNFMPIKASGKLGKLKLFRRKVFTQVLVALVGCNRVKN